MNCVCLIWYLQYLNDWDVGREGWIWDKFAFLMHLGKFGNFWIFTVLEWLIWYIWDVNLLKFGIYFWIFTVLEWLRYREKVEFWDKFGINIDNYDELCMLDLIFTVFEWLRCRERRLNLGYIWENFGFQMNFGQFRTNFGWISDEFRIKGHVIWMLQSNRFRVQKISKNK